MWCHAKLVSRGATWRWSDSYRIWTEDQSYPTRSCRRTHEGNPGYSRVPTARRREDDNDSNQESACDCLKRRKGGCRLIAPSAYIPVTGLISDESIFERGTDALLSSTAYARGESPLSHELIPSSPYLSEADDRDLHDLYGCLRAMCSLAQRSGVRIAFDAEQSWIQPCLDRLVDLLSAEFNSSGSLVVYNTYQANTRQSLDAVRRDLVRARDSGEYRSVACRIEAQALAPRAPGYVLGVKLVRGAYVTSENARAMRTGSPSKVWSTKAESDSCFDACASLLLDEVIKSVKQNRPGPSVIFATHNAKSVQKNIQQLNRAGLIGERDSAYSVDNRLRGRVVFAQLMGEMSHVGPGLTHIY